MQDGAGARPGGATLLTYPASTPGRHRHLPRSTRLATIDVAREQTAAFRVDDPASGDTSQGSGRAAVHHPVPGVAILRTAVDVVADLDLDACDDPQLDGVIRGVQQQLDRLTAARDRLVATRHRRRLIAAGPGREAAVTRDNDRQLVGELGLSPGEAKRTRETGRHLLDDPDLAAAVNAGRLRPEQARVIGDTLRDAPLETHDELAGDLMAAAATQNPTQLGATARRRLAELDQDAAVDAERRRYRRRTGRLSRGSDGMLDVHARFSGLDAETVLGTFNAFLTPDPPGSPARTPEQRMADAIVAACRAALDGGSAPADRGVKPHLIVTVALDDLVRRQGAGEGRWNGPIPVRELERLAANATIHVLGLDVNGLPIALSRAHEHVTASQYLAFAHRDGGCRYPGCDSPPEWCDVAHGVARRHRGRITPDNALLLCRRHHRLIDEGNWTIAIDGWDATFTHPNGRVVQAGRARGQPGDGRGRPVSGRSWPGDAAGRGRDRSRTGGTDPPV